MTLRKTTDADGVGGCHRGRMRLSVTAFATALMLSALPSHALGGWSSPRTFALGTQSTGGGAVAVSARGDAAVAWSTVRRQTATRSYLVTVRLAVRTSRGRLITRRLWSSHHAKPPRPSVVVGAGEVTVAWGSPNLAGTSTTVRAAHGPLIGRWSRPRVVGRMTDPGGYPPTPLYPRLAIAPNSDVLLAWNAWDPKNSGMRGIAVAWRPHGRSFGATRVLRSAPFAAVPQFDVHGNAYLHGYCEGVLLIAPTQSHHRFSRRVVVTPGRVLGFNLSVGRAGSAIASWIAGQCSFDAAAGDTPGPVYASVLDAGTFGVPVAIAPPDTRSHYTHAVALPGGGMVTFATPTDTFEVPMGADGLPGPATLITGGLVSLASDGGGDLVFASPPDVGLPGAASPVVVRPAGGGADQPAPVRYGEVAVAAPVGRAVAITWDTSGTGIGPTQALSVWRP